MRSLGLLLGGLERMYTLSIETAKNITSPPDKAGLLFGTLAAMEDVSLHAFQQTDRSGEAVVFY